MCIALLSDSKLPQTAQGHLNSLSEVVASASLHFHFAAPTHNMRAGCGDWEGQKDPNGRYDGDSPIIMDCSWLSRYMRALRAINIYK